MNSPHFCDWEIVDQAIRGKTVAIVGSGPGILTNEPGFIDSYDVVVRVNNYVLTGPVTGKRTDIHYSFYGASIRKRADQLKVDGVKLCIAKCPNAQFMESEWHRLNRKMKGVDFRYIYQQRARFWFCDTYVPTVDEFIVNFTLLGGHIPTTGFAAIQAVLKCDPKSIYLTGFDFFQSRIHNLKDKWKPGNPFDPICHVPDIERKWVNKNRTRFSYDRQLAKSLQSQVAPILPPERYRPWKRRKAV